MPFNLPDPRVLLITLPGILIAITLHEAAHGYAAFLMGDPTAKAHGRLSLNPLKHLDPVGFLLLLTAGFGWAKPVPINPNYFKDRKKGLFLVSIAGVVTNLILAIFFSILLGAIVRHTYYYNEILIQILFSAIGINVVLAVFNLLPFPPLDGSKVILSFLPDRAGYYYYKYERYFRFVLLALIILNIVDLFLHPMVDFVLDLLLTVFIL